MCQNGSGVIDICFISKNRQEETAIVALSAIKKEDDYVCLLNKAVFADGIERRMAHHLLRSGIKCILMHPVATIFQLFIQITVPFTN